MFWSMDVLKGKLKCLDFNIIVHVCVEGLWYVIIFLCTRMSANEIMCMIASTKGSDVDDKG